MKTVPAAVRSSRGGRRPKVDFAKLDSWWSQVVPMPSYTIPECIPAQIHAKGAAWVAFHRCENTVKTHLRTHTPVTSGGPSPPRGWVWLNCTQISGTPSSNSHSTIDEGVLLRELILKRSPRANRKLASLAELISL